MFGVFSFAYLVVVVSIRVSCVGLNAVDGVDNDVPIS